jgi:hypothetical protein
MTKRQLVLTAVGLGVSALVAVASSDANIPRRDYLTFSGAVALPGVTLTPGEYTFEVVAGKSDLVLVRKGRDLAPVYLGFTRTVLRPADLPSNRAVTIGEAPAGSAPPISAWYELGSRTGHEFVYDRR